MSDCDEYCANHGCNKGPSCPAGWCCHGLPGCKDTHCPGHPARQGVARVGRQTPKSPDPAAFRREQVMAIVKAEHRRKCWRIVVLAVLSAAIAAVLWSAP